MLNPRLVKAGATALAMAGSAIIGIGVKKAYTRLVKSKKARLAAEAPKATEPVKDEQPIEAVEAAEPVQKESRETIIAEPVDPEIQAVLDAVEPEDEVLETATEYNDEDIDDQEDLNDEHNPDNDDS